MCVPLAGRGVEPRGAKQRESYALKQIDVENELYCLQLLKHLGLPVNRAEIMTFGQTRVLVVERFDRTWSNGRLIRLPQEDCCQALSMPPSRKYQGKGDPGLLAIANLLKGADVPADDHRTLFQAQLVFWLIGATDGHAKNFSIFLHPGGGYALTPLYDVLTTQRSLDAHQIERKQMKLAMSVGNNHHSRIDEIQARHFFQMGEAAGLSRSLVRKAVEDIAARMDDALASLEAELPADFPPVLHDSVSAGVQHRMRVLRAGLDDAPGRDSKGRSSGAAVDPSGVEHQERRLRPAALSRPTWACRACRAEQAAQPRIRLVWSVKSDGSGLRP